MNVRRTSQHFMFCIAAAAALLLGAACTEVLDSDGGTSGSEENSTHGGVVPPTTTGSGAARTSDGTDRTGMSATGSGGTDTAGTASATDRPSDSGGTASSGNSQTPGESTGENTDSGASSVPSIPESTPDRPAVRCHDLSSDSTRWNFVQMRVDILSNVECEAVYGPRPIDAQEWEIFFPGDDRPYLGSEERYEFQAAGIGVYSACATMRPEDGEFTEEPVCMDIIAQSDEELVVQLRWEHSFGGRSDPLNPDCASPGFCAPQTCGMDLDLFVRRGDESEWLSEDGVNWRHRDREWGETEASLALDVMFGAGPETIVLADPEPGEVYHAGAHVYSDAGWSEEDVTAIIEIFAYNVLISQSRQTLDSQGAFWSGVRVEWNGDDTAPSDVRVSSEVFADVCEQFPDDDSCDFLVGQTEHDRCW